MSGGCICPGGRDQEAIHRLAGHAPPSAEKTGRGGKTYHDACAGVAHKVQLAVYLADVVSLRPCGSEKRYHVVVVILELEDDRWQPRSASRDLGRARGPLLRVARGGRGRHTHHDVIERVVRWAPSILVAVWAVEYPPVLNEHAGRVSRYRAGARDMPVRTLT